MCCVPKRVYECWNHNHAPARMPVLCYSDLKKLRNLEVGQK